MFASVDMHAVDHDADYDLNNDSKNVLRIWGLGGNSALCVNVPTLHLKSSRTQLMTWDSSWLMTCSALVKLSCLTRPSGLVSMSASISDVEQ